MGAVAPHDLNCLAHRQTRRHDVFDDQYAIVGREGEPASQRCHTVFLLDEDGFRPKLSCHFVRNQNTADGGANDDRRRKRWKLFRDRARDDF